MAHFNQMECSAVGACASTSTSNTMRVQGSVSSTSRPNDINGVGTIIRIAVDALINRYKCYQSRVALHRLNDNQLCDIGLERVKDQYRLRDEYLHRY